MIVPMKKVSLILMREQKEEALKKILEQMYKLYPDATEKEIRKEI